MNLNPVLDKELAFYLLEKGFVTLVTSENGKSYYTWTSGIKSPIYCDNRKTLSHPKTRSHIKKLFKKMVTDLFPEVEVIAGVATAGVPHGAILADFMDLPFVYVRDKAKAHGLENLIEGTLEKGQKIVVIEDLLSTGGSSLKAVDALRAAGGNVLGLGAIFTYAFQKADDAFEKANCPYFTLSDYPTLLGVAVEKGFVQPNQEQILLNWYKKPEEWAGLN